MNALERIRPALWLSTALSRGAFLLPACRCNGQDAFDKPVAHRALGAETGTHRLPGATRQPDAALGRDNRVAAHRAGRVDDHLDAIVHAVHSWVEAGERRVVPFLDLVAPVTLGDAIPDQAPARRRS